MHIIENDFGDRERLVEYFWGQLRENFPPTIDFPRVSLISHLCRPHTSEKPLEKPKKMAFLLPPLPPLKIFARNPLVKATLLAIFCFLSYFIASYPMLSPSIASMKNDAKNCSFQLEKKKNLNGTHENLENLLNFEPQHTLPLPFEDTPERLLPFPDCPRNYTNYCPCQDPNKEELFTVDRMFHRERHCPERGERLRCLVPKPRGYRRPFPWPKSRDYAWFSNVPFKRLTEYKKNQNWVRLEGGRLFFPGGGTSFPQGVKGYIDQLKLIVPLRSGAIRTVLDVGCGVSSNGILLLDFSSSNKLFTCQDYVIDAFH